MDTKNAINKSVDALGGRLDSSHQQLGQQVSDALSLIRQDHGETRDRASAAASQASQTAGEVAALKREVNALRRTVEDLADLIRSAPAAPAPAPEQPIAESLPKTPPAPLSAATTPGVLQADAAGSVPATQPTSGSLEEDHATGAEEAESDTDTQPPIDDQKLPDPEHDERTSHRALLLQAAGIARVNVVCHRDAWDFITQRATGHEHFGITPTVTDQTDGLVRVTLSGRSLIGMLITLRTTDIDRRKDFDGSWALASRLYSRIADDLYKASREGGTPLTIVFNDGITEAAPHDDSDAPGTAAN
ncbi:hypothetical protein ACFC09_08425 [Streptomyces sp. NPDC056161]|uniref:hypothetical protein n=1 Tax=Streptomyces sp. NPDC056161 TaxID=3345732 RepID=UPI0035D9DB4A